MRSWKVATLTALSVAFASCGETENSPSNGGTGGQAGQASGGAAVVPDPVACGRETCRAVSIPGAAAVAPCCADAAKGICGAELGALGPTAGCQPLTQPGQLDSSCPATSAVVMGGLPLPPFPGCCREAQGECGVMISDLGGVLPFAPGCVSAQTFMAGGSAQACGAGIGTGGGTGAPAAGSGGGTGAPAAGSGGAGGNLHEGGDSAAGGGSE